MKNLKVFADELFASNPKVNAFHLTSDGQGFERVKDAITHGRTLADKEVKEFQRDGSDEATQTKTAAEKPEFTVKEMEARFAQVNTAEEVDELIASDETRKSVFAAAAARKEAIATPAPEVPAQTTAAADQTTAATDQPDGKSE